MSRQPPDFKDLPPVISHGPISPSQGSSPRPRVKWGNNALRLDTCMGAEGPGLGTGHSPHPGIDLPGGPANVFTAATGRLLPKFLTHNWPAPQQLCTPRHDPSPSGERGALAAVPGTRDRTDPPHRGGLHLAFLTHFVYTAIKGYPRGFPGLL